MYIVNNHEFVDGLGEADLREMSTALGNALCIITAFICFQSFKFWLPGAMQRRYQGGRPRVAQGRRCPWLFNDWAISAVIDRHDVDGTSRCGIPRIGNPWRTLGCSGWPKMFQNISQNHERRSQFLIELLTCVTCVNRFLSGSAKKAGIDVIAHSSGQESNDTMYWIVTGSSIVLHVHVFCILGAFELFKREVYPIDLTAESWHWKSQWSCDMLLWLHLFETIWRYDESWALHSFAIGVWDCFIGFPHGNPSAAGRQLPHQRQRPLQWWHGTYRSAPYQISATAFLEQIGLLSKVWILKIILTYFDSCSPNYRVLLHADRATLWAMHLPWKVSDPRESQGPSLREGEGCEGKDSKW